MSRPWPPLSRPMCPRCNTPLKVQKIDAPPFAWKGEGPVEWEFRECPCDGCCWLEYAELVSGTRWTHDGRRLEAGNRVG